jgi:hypothetical protein
VTALTADAVRRSMINCSKGDAKRVTLADHVVGTDLTDVEFVGWRDPRMPQRAYVVTLHEGAVTGVLLRPAAGDGPRRTAMCALCRTTRSDDAVTLFTAPRAGVAGREGNSVGTYICDDLACPVVTASRRRRPPSSPTAASRWTSTWLACASGSTPSSPRSGAPSTRRPHRRTSQARSPATRSPTSRRAS